MIDAIAFNARPSSMAFPLYLVGVGIAALVGFLPSTLRAHASLRWPRTTARIRSNEDDLAIPYAPFPVAQVPVPAPEVEQMPVVDYDYTVGGKSFRGCTLDEPGPASILRLIREDELRPGQTVMVSYDHTTTRSQSSILAPRRSPTSSSARASPYWSPDWWFWPAFSSRDVLRTIFSEDRYALRFLPRHRRPRSCRRGCPRSRAPRDNGAHHALWVSARRVPLLRHGRASPSLVDGLPAGDGNPVPTHARDDGTGPGTGAHPARHCVRRPRCLRGVVCTRVGRARVRASAGGAHDRGEPGAAQKRDAFSTGGIRPTRVDAGVVRARPPGENGRRPVVARVRRGGGRRAARQVQHRDHRRRGAGRGPRIAGAALARDTVAVCGGGVGVRPGKSEHRRPDAHG